MDNKTYDNMSPGQGETENNMSPEDIGSSIPEDKISAYNTALEAFDGIANEAEKEAVKLTEDLVKRIVTKRDDYDITKTLMVLARSMVSIISFAWDNEDEFAKACKRARELVAEDVVPALLDPKPCGSCENCKNGDEDHCLKPIVRARFTETKFIPILAAMLVEYDLFNKFMYVNVFDGFEAETP